MAAAIAIPLALGVISASKARAQKTQASDGPWPRFEMASIKMNTIPRPIPIDTYYGNRFVATNTTYGLIRLAYGDNYSPLKPDQVSGGPDWIKSEVLDIEAKVDDSLVEREWKKLSYDERHKQAMLMLRSLLADRFKLNVRHETKVLPVYVLLLAEGGPKFSEDDTQAKNWRVEGHGSGEIEAVSADLGWVAGLASGLLGNRIVLNKTGLHGHYSMTFQPPPLKPAASDDLSAGSAAPSDSSVSLLSAALEKQLGLRLESTTAPVDTIVIENIEQPTGN